MKREIEFKAKRLNGRKQFVYGLLHENLDGLMITETVEEGAAYAHTVIDPETIGEYTGLKDLDGKKIYEGDILTFKTGGNDIRFVVKWDDKEAGFEKWMPRNKVIILGNIYDNPELLKQRQND